MNIRTSVAAIGLATAVAAGQTRPAKFEVPRTVSELELAAAADPDYFSRRDEDGRTALMAACMRGDAVVVRRMLELGADARAAGAREATALHAVMAGADLDGNIRGMPPKGEAGEWSVEQARARERATRGQGDPKRGPMQFVETAKALLEKGAMVDAKMEDGATPLYLAAEAGQGGLVALLISAGADANAVRAPRGQSALTPIVAAAGRGDAECVRLLLDAGADLKKVPAESRRFMVSRAMSDIDVFRLLLDRGMELPADAMKRAAQRGRAEIIAEIHKRQAGGGKAADTAGLDAALLALVKEGESSLSQGQHVKLVETVGWLLQAGASPSGPDGTGEALAQAVLHERMIVANMLKGRGGRVDWGRVKDAELQPFKAAYSALFEGKLWRLRELEGIGMPLEALGAAALGREERLRAVLKGDPSQAKGAVGAHALYFAAREGQLGSVRMLLDGGADVNERVPSWDTPDIGPRPLEGAAVGGHVAVVKLLLERGADIKLAVLREREWAGMSEEMRGLMAGASRR